MPRRSDRLKSQVTSGSKRQLAEFPSTESDSEYEPEEPMVTRRKIGGPKQNKTKRLRGKRGILQRMLDMPLDVLFEVRRL